MVLDPIPQSLPVHIFGSRPQPPTSHPIFYDTIASSHTHMYAYIQIHICKLRVYYIYDTMCITFNVPSYPLTRTCAHTYKYTYAILCICAHSYTHIPTYLGTLVHAVCVAVCVAMCVAVCVAEAVIQCVLQSVVQRVLQCLLYSVLQCEL